MKAPSDGNPAQIQNFSVWPKKWARAYLKNPPQVVDDIIVKIFFAWYIDILFALDRFTPPFTRILHTGLLIMRLLTHTHWHALNIDEVRCWTNLLHCLQSTNLLHFYFSHIRKKVQHIILSKSALFQMFFKIQIPWCKFVLRIFVFRANGIKINGGRKYIHTIIGNYFAKKMCQKSLYLAARSLWTIPNDSK